MVDHLFDEKAPRKNPGIDWHRTALEHEIKAILEDDTLLDNAQRKQISDKIKIVTRTELMKRFGQEPNRPGPERSDSSKLRS